MYNLKRILEEMSGAAVSMMPGEVRRLVQEATVEVEKLEKDQLDAPQEMRDLFAAAALIGSEANNKNSFASQERQAEYCWNFSDAMMSERAKRSEARKAVQS